MKQVIEMSQAIVAVDDEGFRRMANRGIDLSRADLLPPDSTDAVSVQVGTYIKKIWHVADIKYGEEQVDTFFYFREPLDCVERLLHNFQGDIRSLERQCENLAEIAKQATLDRVQTEVMFTNMGFWRRLAFLFTGSRGVK